MVSADLSSYWESFWPSCEVVIIVRMCLLFDVDVSHFCYQVHGNFYQMVSLVFL